MYDVEFRIAKLPTGRFAILYKEGDKGAPQYVPVAFETEEDARAELQRQVDMHNEKMEELLYGEGVASPFGLFVEGGPRELLP